MNSSAQQEVVRSEKVQLRGRPFDSWTSLVQNGDLKRVRQNQGCAQCTSGAGCYHERRDKHQVLRQAMRTHATSG
eukprot:5491037-Pleurochrysis_carterae.AAC.1